ncbi:MAG: hypothetical protein J3K34DRAFT_120686 [Monoraphidium minutum]|nr:MAG: hypothetical protein J3K34DRAFT_120686 [Monoraphidium minutum]
MARTLYAALALLLAAAAAPMAHARAATFGCTTCASCASWTFFRDSVCYRICRPSCGPAPTPDNVYVDDQWCIQSGAAAGRGAAASACAYAQSQCGANFGEGAGQQAYGSSAMPLSQCANAMMGSCQSASKAAAPCWSEMRFGTAFCSAWKFQGLFDAAAKRSCYAQAAAITGVHPGSNDWDFGSSLSAAPGGGDGGGAGRLLGAGRRMLHSL